MCLLLVCYCDHFLLSSFLALTGMEVLLQVDYGLDLEQHLEFLVECRATFGNMDLIRVRASFSYLYSLEICMS